MTLPAASISASNTSRSYISSRLRWASREHALFGLRNIGLDHLKRRTVKHGSNLAIGSARLRQFDSAQMVKPMRRVKARLAFGIGCLIVQCAACSIL